MSVDVSQPSLREQQLQVVLVEYLEAIERGEAPDLKSWQSRYHEFAAELAAFAANRQQLDRLVGPLRSAAESAVAQVDAERTLGVDEAKDMPVLGTTVRYFGDYELLEEVGRGGMGVVYRAKQVSLNRIVALKMILTGQLADDTDVKRFHAEAEAAAKLDHPGIVSVFEVGLHEQHHYFTMAFVEGQSLAKKLSQGLPEPREAAELIRKVADAVAFAHVEGVVHRDLKPANILIDRHGQPRLTDFGLAKRLDSEPAAGGGLTATGQVLGTPSYMSPEQASGKRGTVGPLTDVYSLGAVLYCLLTGRPPFQAANTLDTLLQVLESEPVAPRQLNPTLPRDLETICLKCLRKEPAKRYASARELSADLDRYLSGKPILARPVGPLGRAWLWCRRKPAVAGAVSVSAAALIAVAGLSIFFAMRESRNAEENKKKVAESYLDKGQTYCEQGDRVRGLLWFTRCLQTAPASATDLQRAARLNLDAWRPQSATIRNLFIYNRTIEAAAFGPDSRTVMLTANSTVQLWDSITGQPLGPEIRIDNEPRSPSLSPDGKFIATGFGVHGTPAMIWDAYTGARVRPLQLKPAEVTKDGTPIINADDMQRAQRTAFSANGKVLATADLRSIQLWDPATGKPLGEQMKGHTDWIEALAVSPDGKLVATGSRDGTARLWDATTSKPIGEPWVHMKGTWVSSLVFSPDGKTLLTGCHHGTIRLWDVATAKLLREPMTHSGWVWTVAFSPDGRTFMSGVGGGENTARLWETATGKQIGMPLMHDSYVNAVAISPDGKTSLTAMRTQSDKDAAIRIWNVPELNLNERILKHDSPIQSVAYHPSGTMIATSGHTLNPYDWKGSVRLWDTNTDQPVGEPLPHKGPVRQLVFAPDGKFLICAMDADWKKYDETSSRRAAEIHIWDAATRQPACKPIELWGEVPQLAFTSDGTLQTLDMTTSSHGLATSWDVRTGQPIGSPQKCKRPIREWSYSPDGRHVMAGNGEDNTGFLYRVDVSSLDAPLHFAVGTIQPSGGVSTSMFSPDSSLVVTAGGTAWVWDVATLKPIGPSFGQANAVAFSPDGKWILTGSSDGNARLWRVPTVVEGDIERITLWVQVNTGAELVQTSRRILRADDWQKKQQRLEELGGPPDMSR